MRKQTVQTGETDRDSDGEIEHEHALFRMFIDNNSTNSYK